MGKGVVVRNVPAPAGPVSVVHDTTALKLEGKERNICSTGKELNKTETKLTGNSCDIHGKKRRGDDGDGET